MGATTIWRRLQFSARPIWCRTSLAGAKLKSAPNRRQPLPVYVWFEKLAIKPIFVWQTHNSFFLSRSLASLKWSGWNEFGGKYSGKRCFRSVGLAGCSAILFFCYNNLTVIVLLVLTHHFPHHTHHDNNKMNIKSPVLKTMTWMWDWFSCCSLTFNVPSNETVYA